MLINLSMNIDPSEIEVWNRSRKVFRKQFLCNIVKHLKQNKILRYSFRRFFKIVFLGFLVCVSARARSVIKCKTKQEQILIHYNDFVKAYGRNHSALPTILPTFYRSHYNLYPIFMEAFDCYCPCLTSSVYYFSNSFYLNPSVFKLTKLVVNLCTEQTNISLYLLKQL